MAAAYLTHPLHAPTHTHAHMLHPPHLTCSSSTEKVARPWRLPISPRSSSTYSGGRRQGSGCRQIGVPWGRGYMQQHASGWIGGWVGGWAGRRAGACVGGCVRGWVRARVGGWVSEECASGAEEHSKGLTLHFTYLPPCCPTPATCCHLWSFPTPATPATCCHPRSFPTPATPAFHLSGHSHSATATHLSAPQQPATAPT